MFRVGGENIGRFLQTGSRARNRLKRDLHLSVELLDSGGQLVLLLLTIGEHRLLINRNRDIHVQHHGAIDRSQDRREMLGFPAVLADRESYELTEYEIIAADIPAWLKADLVMDMTYRPYAMHVLLIEPAVEQAGPVRSLRCLEPRNIVTDQTRELGLPGNVLVKAFEQLR